MTTPEAGWRAAEELVLAWANEDTFVGGEPSLRERERLVARITTAIAQAVAQAQTDLAGAEATAETLRLALAESNLKLDGYKELDAFFAEKDVHPQNLVRELKAMRAQIAQAEQRGRAVSRIIDEWEAAYPESVFRPFTAAEHPNVSPDRIAAQMGRHMAREMRKQLAALTPAEGSA